MKVVGKDVRIATITLNPALDEMLEIPNFHVGEVNRVEKRSCFAAGKGINVAAFLRQLSSCSVDSKNYDVSVLGFLGDANDGPFRALFHRLNITDAMTRVSGPTRTNIKIMAAAGTTDINVPGAPVTAGDVAGLLAAVTAAAPGHGVFVLAGSLPSGVDAAFLQSLVSQLREAGVVVVDTSGPALAAAVRASPDIIKPNEDELAELCPELPAAPTLADYREACRALVSRHGVGLVALTLGQRGCLLVTADECVHAAQDPTAHVPVVSTVGAGDAFLAGLVGCLISGDSLATAACTATEVAMRTLGQVGPFLCTEVGKAVVVPWDGPAFK
ncbi:Tagatose/fructose phosphokinase [Carpediemonas membranifera]|uniref:Tagatose/fructose phosphokinase n=1 Tax=Carpediemonas membranifera TaxID=201153 RepID=A0A8J6AX87_9EUKA|nr:Tagatose/fructose phosphokinase [Carpediemonas membranifera]|eukprot:KAG9390603.1 Tagatose/fructose phosphokinase [Carpediemonas membranifera]